MKKCTSCGVEKSDDEFQKRKASHDGLTASCKSCLRDRDKARYPKERLARLEKHREYMNTVSGKQSHSASVEKWKENNKLKRAAHVILNHAIRDGKVEKLPCIVCGETVVEGHHPDYSAPLDVVWLCPAHHKQAHALAKELACPA